MLCECVCVCVRYLYFAFFVFCLFDDCCSVFESQNFFLILLFVIYIFKCLLFSLWLAIISMLTISPTFILKHSWILFFSRKFPFFSPFHTRSILLETSHLKHPNFQNNQLLDFFWPRARIIKKSKISTHKYALNECAGERKKKKKRRISRSHFSPFQSPIHMQESHAFYERFIVVTATTLYCCSFFLKYQNVFLYIFLVLHIDLWL